MIFSIEILERLPTAFTFIGSNDLEAFKRIYEGDCHGYNYSNSADPVNFLSASAAFGRMEFVGYLMTHLTINSFGYAQAMRFAAANNHLDIFKHLDHAPQKPDFYPDAFKEAYERSLNEASENGHLNVVLHLMRNYRFPREDIDYAIRLAAINNHGLVMNAMLILLGEDPIDLTSTKPVVLNHLKVLSPIIKSALDEGVVNQSDLSCMSQYELEKILKNSLAQAALRDGLFRISDLGEYTEFDLIFSEVCIDAVREPNPLFTLKDLLKMKAPYLITAKNIKAMKEGLFTFNDISEFYDHKFIEKLLESDWCVDALNTGKETFESIHTRYKTTQKLTSPSASQNAHTSLGVFSRRTLVRGSECVEDNRSIGFKFGLYGGK